MRKKQGFTLIELLAVIVILAVIALIATPIIIGIIEDSRESAFKSSLYSIFDAAEYKLVQDKNTEFPNEGIDVPSLSMNNNKFTSGTVFQENKGMYLENVSDGKYCGNGYKGKLEVPKGECIPYTDESAFTFDKETGTIMGFDWSTPKIVIPRRIDGVPVKRIEDNTFMHMYFLESVTIPDSVTYIGNYAFIGNFLTEIIIPDSVTEIGEEAFSSNELTSVIIPNGVTSIGNWAFSYNKLTSIAIPNSVVSIGIQAFGNNQLPDNQAFIYNRNSDGSENQTSLNSYGGANRKNIIIPSNITSIGDFAFKGNNLTGITIPNTVTTIGINAFADNLLTNITIPNNVTSIGNRAFSSNKLANITIPNNVISIGNSCFNNSKLINITIPNSVISIEQRAFSGNKLTSVTIPSSVTSIGNSAFSNNQLTSVKIIGKSSSSDFTKYAGAQIWGWATGYNDSNITWNATE